MEDDEPHFYVMGKDGKPRRVNVADGPEWPTWLFAASVPFIFAAVFWLLR